jgi:hypothetical protein
MKSFQKHPVPYRNAVRRLIEKFRETGSVLDGERIVRPSELGDKKLLDVSDYAAECIKIIGASWRKRKISILQQRIKRPEENRTSSHTNADLQKALLNKIKWA